VYPFRGGFQYQSIMWLAAGEVVAKHDPDGWGGFVRKRVLGPLGLKGVTLTTPEIRRGEHALGSYRDPEGRVRPLPMYEYAEPNAASSVSASARDLATWLRFHLGDGTWKGERLVQEAAFAETRTPQTLIRMDGNIRLLNPDTNVMNYAMGWVVQDYRGRLQLQHGGVIDGYRVILTLLPEERIGIAVLVNQHGTRLIQAVSNHIVDHILGLPERNWNKYYLAINQRDEQIRKDRRAKMLAKRDPSVGPSVALKDLAGDYEDALYGTARVRLTDDGLVWEWGTRRDRLEHIHGDQFLILDKFLDDDPVTFEVRGGRAVAMSAIGATFKRE
jgi:CubicO group peptidase (beta-lactamase class C family)